MPKLPIDFEKVITTIPQGVTIQDLEGSVVFANPAALKIMGRSPKLDLRKKSQSDLTRQFTMMNEQGEPLSVDKLPGRVALQTHEAAERVVRFRYMGGQEERWSLVKAVPLKDDKGNISGVVNTFYDLTKIKSAEAMGRFVSKTQNIIASTMDHDTRIKALATAAVPDLADWCLVDMLGKDGKLHRKALVHSDPAKVMLAQELEKGYPSGNDNPLGTLRVVKYGKPVLYSDVTPEIIGAKVRDKRHLKIIEAFEIRSVIILPLTARGKILGTATFIFSESGRRYDKESLHILEFFASRASLLIDNSRLFQEAQEIIQKQNEVLQILQQSDNTLRLALDVGSMGIWDWDILHDVFTWSDGFKPMYGLRHGNIGGNLEKFLQHVYPADRARVLRGLKNAIKKTSVYEDKFRILWPDNTVRWMMKKGQVMRDEDGRVRMIGIGMDVTERTLAEHALQVNEHKFKTIFESSLDAIMITDNSMKIMDMNEAAAHLFKQVKAKMRNRKLLSFIAEDDKKIFTRNWKNLHKKLNQRAEMSIERSDHTTCMVEYSAKAEYLPGRNLFILRDITDRKKEELRRDHLLGIVSHELRTPLASIKAFAEILHRRVSKLQDEKSMEYLSKINDKASTLAQLVSNLLDMTRIGGGKLEFYHEMFDFDVFLKELLKDIQMTLVDHTIQTRGKTGKEIVADRNRISQVVTNLVKNAAKYSPNAKEIIVRSSFIDEQIRFSVQDFGLGILQREQHKIFDMFYRAENLTEKRVVGLGVGLYISAEIVKKHGGKIWVRSKKGEGSTFFVSLPLHPKK